MKKKIKVGIIHSLRGTMSFSEAPLVDAALMAFDEINSSGGVLGAMISPMVEDCTSDAETYAVKTSRMIKRCGIRHFFGCWTSDSRKAVKPVVEKHDALLWYPVQYEGLEESPNIVYTGNCLNQQIEPTFNWAVKNIGSKCYLVGSDYVFPRTANKLIRTLCQKHGVQVLGERYLPLGAENFERIVDDIITLKPDVVFNTINGDSNLAFYYHLGQTGNSPDKIPVMAFSIGEVELRDIGLSVIGHYACCGYFQCIETEENRKFIKQFKDRYGKNRVVSDPVVSAYLQPFLWKQLVEKSNSFDISILKRNISGIAHNGPAGRIKIHRNHHAVRPALIGKVNSELQFDIVWQHPRWIDPQPWLGLERMDFDAGQMVKDAMAALPVTLELSGKLKHEEERRKQAESDLKKDRATLKEIRSKYQHLFKTIAAGIVIIEIASGRIHDCNPRFADYFGKPRAHLKNRYIWELGPADQYETTKLKFFKHENIGEGNLGEITLSKQNGQSDKFQYQSDRIFVKGVAMLQAIIT